MPDARPDDHQVEDELEITDLRPRPARTNAAGGARRPRRDATIWRRVTLGGSLVLLLAAFVGALPATRDALSRLAGRFATPTPSIVSHGQVFVPAFTLPTPSGPVPTALPGASGVPALGPAPTGCEDNPAAPLRTAAPPSLGKAIGQAPVWVSGFEGPYPTLRIKAGENAQGDNAPYGWPMHYTQYGWPVPIDLMLAPEVSGPVTLAGWDPNDRHPLWFGFVTIPTETPPAEIAPTFTLDPLHPSVFQGGFDQEAGFWYGYAFVPKAGCYVLTASWPGGAWKVLISAGR